MLNCILMCLSKPDGCGNNPHDPTLREKDKVELGVGMRPSVGIDWGFLGIADLVFNLIFLSEFLVKICANGCSKYFGDQWNWLDFIVVCEGTLSLFVVCVGAPPPAAAAVPLAAAATRA